MAKSRLHIANRIHKSRSTDNSNHSEDIHILLDLNGCECLYHAQIGVGNHLYSAGRKCKWHNRLFFSFLSYLYFYCEFDVILMQKSNIKVITIIIIIVIIILNHQIM